ncbi:MAG TPA: hypothetical protein IAB68_04600 [Candidatus Aphodocola excrementigallinarum]|uniref:Uncharacterized protein n=1 Tax=Candidatus Aphodocola excrementigallinarum TaxID=2840670 RepID=A0A9D1IRD5_9FIRM|nr:hypothetical protein [Candidatus Aphodocola excrementigallinarum]
MKKNRFDVISAIIILILFGLMIVKNIIFNIDVKILNYVYNFLIILILFVLNNKFFKKEKKVNKFINIVLIVNCLLELIFNSYSGTGFILFYAFILLITFACMIKTKLRFEVSLVISISILIFGFIILGLLNLLSLSLLFLLLVSLALIYYIYRNNDLFIKNLESVDVKTIIIFSILFLIAILGGVGRYVHSYDEYSYWGYAAKVAINENSLYSVISKLGVTRAYPPVSTIWHYIVSLFCGYSEPNLYIGLSILTFIYLMPAFMYIINKKTFTIFIFLLAIVFFPLIFNGSITYTLLYVDLLLGVLCGASIILESYCNKHNLKKWPVLLLLLVITMLKANGFVFSLSLLLLFYLKDLSIKKLTFKNIWKTLKKYILPGILILCLFVLWRLFASSDIIKSVAYDYSLMPDSLKPDLLPKLNLHFILDFCNNVLSSVDETIVYGFISIPLFAYLIIIFYLIYRVDFKESKVKNIFCFFLPYVISYSIFFCLTALSLFVMFSKYEASTLASFGRYLAPINIAFMIYVLYRLSDSKDISALNILSLVLIVLVGFSNITYFLTDIKTRRDTIHISESRQNDFSIINEKTNKNSKIFIINQTDENTIMPLWYARYYAYPRIVNSSPYAITWKIKTPSNEWDLQDWGLTKDKFINHLIKEDFDYVYFYTTTDEFNDELNDIIDGNNNIENRQLFKIKNTNGTIKLKLIK